MREVSDKRGEGTKGRTLLPTPPETTRSVVSAGVRGERWGGEHAPREKRGGDISLLWGPGWTHGTVSKRDVGERKKNRFTFIDVIGSNIGVLVH